jgi:hypothetical protein
MTTVRNGHTRGTGPKRPGDLTGRTLVANQAEKRVRENPPVDIDAIRNSAWKSGHDAGFSDGVRWIQETYDVFIKEDETGDE